MQIASAEPATVVEKIRQNDETDPADDDQKRHGQKDRRVGAECGERSRPEYVEPRVAERRDRGEQRVVQSFRPELMSKAQEENQRSDPLGREGRDTDPADQGDDPADREVSLRLHQDILIVQTHPFAEHQIEQRNDGHKAEPAELDQDEDHDLAEETPSESGVERNQTGHAGRGRRGEQAVDVGVRRPGRRREGETQERRTEQNDQRVPEKQGPDDRYSYLFQNSLRSFQKGCFRF